MSDEYWLRMKDASTVLAIAEDALTAMGLVRGAASATHLSMSWPDADPSVEAWGGNVHLSRDADRVLLTINGIGGPDQFAQSLAEALVARGLEVRVEDT